MRMFNRYEQIVEVPDRAAEQSVFVETYVFFLLLHHRKRRPKLTRWLWLWAAEDRFPHRQPNHLPWRLDRHTACSCFHPYSSSTLRPSHNTIFFIVFKATFRPWHLWWNYSHSPLRRVLLLHSLPLCPECRNCLLPHSCMRISDWDWGNLHTRTSLTFLRESKNTSNMSTESMKKTCLTAR